MQGLVDSHRDLPRTSQDRLQAIREAVGYEGMGFEGVYQPRPVEVIEADSPEISWLDNAVR